MVNLFLLKYRAAYLNLTLLFLMPAVFLILQYYSYKAIIKSKKFKPEIEVVTTTSFENENK